MTFDSKKNLEKTKKIVGYVDKKKANRETYSKLGFRCGLEIHQQLKTRKKLFCRCPAGIYQESDDFDAQVIRHMRPTLSELGEYDGTALMEFKTRKNIFYRIKNNTACTYEIDDTPPFKLDKEALSIALEIAMLLNTSIVGELHITRKQYLDGSIPTGFQRTGIIGIEGEIPLRHKKIRILQLSIEEDACREVSDIGHNRIYLTDRLGMPLVESVTYPDMETPDEAAEAAQYLRFLTRSTNQVRTGIGAAREDVNVSITGGDRVEIKGVAHIKQIPVLTHNEAFRQKALLEIRKILKERIPDPKSWKINSTVLSPDLIDTKKLPDPDIQKNRDQIMAVNLPEFKGLLSFFTQPGKMFADELHDRLKVIACLEKPNMTHSEILEPNLIENELSRIKEMLACGENDAQIIFWGPEEDIKTALETIEERCLLSFEGVPNETRKALNDGTTIFERVLPGPDRMYPDTDSPPIPIDDRMIQEIQRHLTTSIASRIDQLKKWNLPADTYTYILKKNLFPLIEKIINDFQEDPVFLGTLIGHTFKHIEGKLPDIHEFNTDGIYDLFEFKAQKQLSRDIMIPMLWIFYQHPEQDFDSLLLKINYQSFTKKQILSRIPELREKFKKNHTSNDASAEKRWIMGQLRPMALGNIQLGMLRKEMGGGTP